MANEWSAVVNTTTAKYLRGAADLTIRERIVFAMMNRRKRISYNHSGTEVKQQVKFALPEVEPYAGGAIDFEPSDKYRQLTLDWRGYKVKDTMTEKERLMNRGVPALINRYAQIMKDMRQSLEDQFGAEVFNDGGTNTDRLDGIETFMGTGTTADGDAIAQPSDTYGGLSTTLGGVAGTWSSDLSTYPNANAETDWPSGSGDTEYDFLSPRCMNFSSSSAWGTGASTWLANCERVIRKAILWTRLGTGKTNRTELCLLADDLYYDYMNKQEAKQRIIVPYKEVQDLGFDGAKQEGVSIVTEYGITPSRGYLWNMDKCELRCMYGQLFVPRGPERDIRTDSYLFLMGFFGNLVFQPKFFSKFLAYA